MGSTTRRLAAELQYAKRTIFSSALQKLSPSERREIVGVTNQLYRKLIPSDSKINKTDIFRLLAAIGAFSALSDVNFARSS